MTTNDDSTPITKGEREYAGKLVGSGIVLTIVSTAVHIIYSMYVGQSLLSESLLVPVGFVLLTAAYLLFGSAIYSRIDNQA
jgi:predicted neutral ceramidase superfamily lipid hydrolase